MPSHDPMPEPHDPMAEALADLGAILRALDLGDHARPVSPHDVVIAEVLPAIERLRKQLGEAWPERPRVAGTVRLVRTGSRMRIEVDGRRFPWDVAIPVNVPVSRKDRPSVLLELIAERVEVVDTITPGPTEADTAEPTSWTCAVGGERQSPTAVRQFMPPRYDVDGPVCNQHAAELARPHRATS